MKSEKNSKKKVGFTAFVYLIIGIKILTLPII